MSEMIDGWLAGGMVVGWSVGRLLVLLVATWRRVLVTATRSRASVARCKLVNELLERRKFLLFDELKLLNEINEMLEGRVEMRLLLKLHDLAEVFVVNVSVDAEETLENGLDDGEKVLGERHADGGRKDGLVVHL